MDAIYTTHFIYAIHTIFVKMFKMNVYSNANMLIDCVHVCVWFFKKAKAFIKLSYYDFSCAKQSIFSYLKEYFDCLLCISTQ